ncbi:SEC-C metal-binding domain-containing protein [Inquilinus sp. CA228]|uniref:SEC-C metal-binding domain-containing protein n=1 Tax=Inquilinus sp. CA228 TaxID=3455609 RepID=UPI003F8D3FD3
MTSWFEKSPSLLEELRRDLQNNYPTLHAHIRHTGVIVAGTFPLVDDAGAVIDRYAVEVVLPDTYPRALPNAWETGGRIPREIDRHIYPKTGALCLGFPAELCLMLAGDFTVGNFIRKALVPYLLGNSLVEAGEPWPFGESAHGLIGALEFYKRCLGTDDPIVIGKFLLDLANNKVRGHWTCPCGSGKPLRKCHGEQIWLLRDVPSNVLCHSIDAMVSILKAKRSGSMPL